MAKYATKSESQAPKFPALLNTVVQNMDNAGSAQSACHKLLNKMLGERTYSAQETAHLLLGVPLVRSSLSFQTLNLGADGGMRQVARQTGGDGGDEIAEDETLTGKSWLQKYVSSVVEMNYF